MSPINTAVLGVGLSATAFHIPFILALPEQFRLHTVLERRATAEHSEAKKAYPDVPFKVVTTLDEVLQDKEIELVVITTINDTHYPFAKAILEAGKNVIVEKPVTPTSEQALELAELAKSRNLVLAVYQNRRLDSDFLTVKSLLESGVFGELSEYESVFDRYSNALKTGNRSWKDAPLPGGGAIFDLGSHLIDQALYLFGKPQKITGLVRNSRNIGNTEVDDSFVVTLQYDALPSTKGRSLPLLVTVRNSILSLLDPQPRFLIRGTDAAFVKGGVDPQEAQLKADGPSAPAKSTFAYEDKSIAGKLYTRDGATTVESKRGDYVRWFQSVAEAISSKDPSKLFVKPEEAALTIKVIETALESSRTGRTIDFA